MFFRVLSWAIWLTFRVFSCGFVVNKRRIQPRNHTQQHETSTYAELAIVGGKSYAVIMLSSNSLPQDIEDLCRALPDADAARRFWWQIAQDHPRIARRLLRPASAGLLADALALAAWSPLLATTLAQNPLYFAWLERQRTLSNSKTCEELCDSLGRFALTNSQLDTHTILSRFRRRELLRLYLRDLRRTATLVETTAELSALADAILSYAQGVARRELESKYGVPFCLDERGRAAPASFAVVALGKLGSSELNYSSDIDLLFLYEAAGSTSGLGKQGAITNREYFCKLAEITSRLVGQPTGEGAAYRVDLRLRPYGRDGALASSLTEAVRYYSERAQAWELQALIRARCATGDAALYANFAAQLRSYVYPLNKTVAHALADVRLAKQKIDQYHAPRTRGYNVKLGRGGIREIEFIAQALQLACGGRDAWLQAPHTLISLSRLSDRQLITERELSELSDAYNFLRTLEHRLQMEHGLQTHLVPEDTARRELIARRMDYAGPTALADFDRALAAHAENVSRAFSRVFETTPPVAVTPSAAAQFTTFIAPVLPANALPTVTQTQPQQELTSISATNDELPPASRNETLLASHAEILPANHAEKLSENAARVSNVSEDAPLHALAQSFAARLNITKAASEKLLRTALAATHHPRRAVKFLGRLAASLDKEENASELPALTPKHLKALAQVCGASEFLGEMLAYNPALITAVSVSPNVVAKRDYHALLSAAVAHTPDMSAALAALRRAWSPLYAEIGAQEILGRLTMNAVTQRQSALAEAALVGAMSIAENDLARRCGRALTDFAPRWAVLGLGRLGSRGMDYGSDLDLLIVYDETAPAPVPALSHAESYRRLAEGLTLALSSLTREGSLYRVDLRLRPDGRNGPTAISAHALHEYLAHRADVWEWLAYIKLRAVAGPEPWMHEVSDKARRIVHEIGQTVPPQRLYAETRRVRGLLEEAKTRRNLRAADIKSDIKYGAGGLLDVYFLARCLQLRDQVPDVGAERSTTATLTRLHLAGSLSASDYRNLREGYGFLRILDHHLRLVLGRGTRLPAADHAALQDIARGLNLASAEALLRELAAHRQAIRAVYDWVLPAT